MTRKIIQIANLLLATAAIFFSVKLFYQFVKMELAQSTPAGISAAEPTARGRAQENRPPFDTYQAIVDRDLFDTVEDTGQKTAQPKINLEELEQTKLNLKLWGTVAAQDNEAGTAWAVIEEPKKRRQGLYRMGDKIQQATIADIYRKGVVLDINGKKEKLTIAQKTDLQDRITPGPVYDPGFSSGTGPPAPGPAKRVTLDQTRVDNALENLNQLMSEVKIRPYFKDGEASGFIVSNIARDSVIREMGLKTGDIVTGINGREIKTADDAMAFYEKLRSGETLSIQLNRRGRPETIEYVVE